MSYTGLIFYACPHNCEHNPSGDSGKVKDTDGNLVFEIVAKMLSFSEKRVIKDASGKEVGQLRKKMLAFPYAAVYIGDTSDEKKCTVKQKG